MIKYNVNRDFDLSHGSSVALLNICKNQALYNLPRKQKQRRYVEEMNREVFMDYMRVSDQNIYVFACKKKK